MTRHAVPGGNSRLAGLARTAVAVFAVVFLLNGSCYYYGYTCDDDYDDDDYDDDDFDDDDFDDDDFDDDDFDDDDCGDDDGDDDDGDDDDVSLALDQNGGDPYRLRKFVRKELDGRTLYDSIEGLSLLELAGPPPYSAEHYSSLSELVIDRNRDFLGPDPEQGALLLRQLIPAGDRMLVVYEQRARTLDGSLEAVPGGELVLLYDANGQLRVLEDRTVEQLDPARFLTH